MKWSAVAADVRQGYGLSADGIASSNGVGPVLEPGKGTLAQDQLLNRAHHGACTRLGPGAPGCYLDDDVRRDYIGDLSEDVGNALTNFKLAVNSVRVKELLKKEEELDWLTGLIIDVAATYLGNAFGKALKKVRELGAGTLSKRIGSNTLANAHTLRRADALLRGVSDSRIESWTKSAFDPVKKRGQSMARHAQNTDSRDQTSDIEGFLKGLSASADDAFRGFLKQMKENATDSEVAVALEGMRLEYHYQYLYEDAVSAKIERYKRSRVRDIGRKLAKDENRITTVARETRVVWVKYHGTPGKTLHYQYQEGGVRAFKSGEEDPGQDYAPPWVMEMLPPWFGVGEDDRTIGARFGAGRGDIKIGPAVPEEFVDLALARSEAIYGVTTVIEPGGDRRDDVLNPRWRPKASSDPTPPPKPGSPTPMPSGGTPMQRWRIR